MGPIERCSPPSWNSDGVVMEQWWSNGVMEPGGNGVKCVGVEPSFKM